MHVVGGRLSALHRRGLQERWRSLFAAYRIRVSIASSYTMVMMLIPHARTNVTWTVDAAGGKKINLQLYDTNGTLASTANIPVVNGTDVSCVKCAGVRVGFPSVGSVG